MHMIFATPILKQRSTVPFRYVMVEKPTEYVVWMETFDDSRAHVGYNGGHYFPFNGDRAEMFKKAYQKYIEKARLIEADILASNYEAIIQ